MKKTSATALRNPAKTVSIGLTTAAAILALTLSGCQPGNTNTPATGGGSSSSGGQNTTALYKDGTYSAVGDYISPGGAEQVGVTVTLKNDVISDVQFEAKATRPNSVRYQGMFAGGYKTLVVGKNIAEVQLDKVSSSSLTPVGFNDALSKIKSQAKA